MTACYVDIIADNFNMNKKYIESLAKRIKELRAKHGFSQDELSFRADIARSTLGNIETAKNDITFTKICKIAQAFDMSISEFFNY